MYKILKNKTILITGGTGSFGKNFIIALLKDAEAKKVIVFSRDELKQFNMQREINNKRLRFFIGDVRDVNRLRRAFREVDVVIHAAALKQVPALEYNPFEAVKTNTIGSQNVIEAAIDTGVGKVLLISTDKAAHPANLYGATKLSAEKLFVAANSYTSGKTRLAVVRYGNVIGSRGSIIETLLGKKDGDKIEITDPEMTRFWITLEQSFSLVMFALNNMVGGEIFVPKIPSMKIGDIFDIMVPNGNKKLIGIRPGEKRHEVLITEQEARRTLELKNYYVILSEFPSFSKDIYKKVYNSGKKLPDGFSFSSDKNESWIIKDQLQAIIQQMRKNIST